MKAKGSIKLRLFERLESYKISQRELVEDIISEIWEIPKEKINIYHRRSFDTTWYRLKKTEKSKKVYKRYRGIIRRIK